MIVRSEYDRRVKTLEEVLEKVGDKVDGMILAGSMAYGDQNTLSQASDADVICIKNLMRTQELAEVEHLRPAITPELLKVTAEELCDTFSIDVRRGGFNIGFHFWDYKALQRTVALAKSNTRYIPRGVHITPDETLRGFKGREFVDRTPQINLEDGNLLDIPIAYDAADDIYLFVQPTNLILEPKVLYDNHIQLQERIDLFWKNLAALYCTKFNAYDPEKPIMNTVPTRIYDKMPKKTRAKVEQRFILEIAKLPR